MITVTNEQLDALLELEAKATPGPWEANEVTHGTVRYGIQMRTVAEDGWLAGGKWPCRTICQTLYWMQLDDNSPQAHNMRLIAAARNSIRPLAKEVLQLRRTVAELRETLLTLLPGLVLDLRHASEDDDKDALRARIQTVREALLKADAPGSEPGASNGIEAVQTPLL